MGLLDRLFGRSTPVVRKDVSDDMFWGPAWGAQSATGVNVNQGTALKATAVLACVTMLCEDFAKLTPQVFRRGKDGERDPAVEHPLYELLYQPNDWQDYFQFAEMMQFSLVMRGNAYAVKIRDGRGKIVKLVPVNADWVALWESPDGALFYRVTPNGLHMLAELRGQPFLIPSEDMFHVRGFSMNGLLGASRMALASEAIGLSIAYERQAAQFAGQGASLSGVLTTDQKLTPDAAARMANDWKSMKSGLQNAGKIAVLEQGLKFQEMTLSAADAQFIASRGMQIQEIARIWRIPAHMIGALERATNNNIAQMATEYMNLTLSSYTSRWAWRWDVDFGLRAQDMFIDYDTTTLTRADQGARYANYARGIMSGFLTPNEARIDDGRDPKPNGDDLLEPANMSVMGSQSSDTGADGGGRPPAGSPDASPTPSAAPKG